MTPIHAFLYAVDDAGAWVTSTFTNLEPWLAAVQVAMAVEEPMVVVHVGFWQPTPHQLAALAAAHAGELIVSDAAAAALGEHLVVGAAAIGCIQGVVFRLAIDGRFRRCDGKGETAAGVGEAGADTSSPAAQTAQAVLTVPAAPSTPRLDWLAALASSDPDLFQRTQESGIGDDESYLKLEAALPRTLRRDLGLARWALILGAPPDIDTILDTLWASPPWMMNLGVAALGLTVRQANVLRTHNLLRVVDLAALGTMGLLKLPNLGQGSVYGLQKLLMDALEGAAGLPFDTTAIASAAPEADGPGTASSSFRAGFKAAAGLLSDAERHVWAGRLGFECPQMTLQELADGMGLTRERVRQLEIQVYRKVDHHAFWQELAARLDAALQSRNSPLRVTDLPALDAWFAETAQLGTALIGVLKRLLRHRFGAFQIDQQWVISQLPWKEWQDACSSARTMIEEGAKSQVEEGLARWQTDQLLRGRGEELREALWAEATSNTLWSSSPGQTRKLVALDRSAPSVALAVLASSDVPLHYVDIHRLASQAYSSEHDLRSIQHAAQEVGILFDRGTYGLPAHCPLSTEELALARAEAEDLISGSDPARQWHASEIFDALLAQGLGFDGRLTKYIVNHALKNGALVVDLRRMVWGLGGQWQAGAASRLDVKQSVISLLEAQGRPMSTAEIRARLEAIRGVNQTFQIFPSNPLVRIGPGLWGLMHRDVDIQAARLRLARLRDILQVRQAGLHRLEMAAVPGLEDPDDSALSTSWLSLADSAGIGIDKWQYAYLVEWGESRRMGVLDSVRVAVAEAGENGVVFEQICRRVNELTEREVPTSQVSQALQGLDLRYDAVRRRWIPGPVDAAT